MSTRLLYHQDPLLFAFDANVVAHGEKNSLVLDETAFYPEGGGQLADHGTLGGLQILDVQIADDGVVRHVVDGALPAIGARVRGEIDRERRRQHMAMHTAQHMLSRALIDVAQAETVSARLGDSVCTVDVDVPALSDASVAKAEALTNALVDDDVAVRAFFPAPDELKALPLRRQPKVAENIRIVQVGDFDFSPCGGTHCTHTSQVAMVRVVGLERYKGMMRVSFQAGARARREAFGRAKTLETLAKTASTSPEEFSGVLDKLRAELKNSHGDKQKLREQMAELLVSRGSVQVVDDVDLARALVAALGKRNSDAFIAAQIPDGLHIICASNTVDCNALVKKSGARGGGKKERAEGKLPSGVDWPKMLKDLALT